jgi:hypothetical protein
MSLSGALTASERGSKRIQMTEFYSLSIETPITICESFFHTLVMREGSLEVKWQGTRSFSFRIDELFLLGWAAPGLISDLRRTRVECGGGRSSSFKNPPTGTLPIRRRGSGDVAVRDRWERGSPGPSGESWRWKWRRAHDTIIFRPMGACIFLHCTSWGGGSREPGGEALIHVIMMCDQVRSGQVRSGQVRSGQVRSGQIRSGQVYYSAEV